MIINSYYNRFSEKGSFKIDLSKYGKGVLYLEVKPVNSFAELTSDGNVYTAQTPFVIPVTQIPVVNGIINFESNDENAITNIRFLLAN